MTEDWELDVEHLFERGGRLHPAACTGLAGLVSAWLVDDVELLPRRLEELVRSVMWNADRREARAQTGLDWSELRDRRSAREGVLGFFFLPPMDESVGLPRTPEYEALVKGSEDSVDPSLQAHRQRSAALREIIFRLGNEKALAYKPSTLFQYGREANAANRYSDRLVGDLRVLVSERSELAIVLHDVFLLPQIRQEWINEYNQLLLRMPDDWRPADRRVRGPASSDLDRDVETLFDSSEFVADVTVPDGTIVQMGDTVVKTWRIRNAGSTPWIGRSLRRMTPQSNTFPITLELVPIATTQPGDEVDVSLEITATHVEGTSELRFKMVDSLGELCFPDRYTYGLIAVITTVRRSARRSVSSSPTNQLRPMGAGDLHRRR